MGYAEPSMREKQLNIRFSPEESARLEAVANHYGLNGAGTIRMLLKREHDKIVLAGLEPEDLELLRTLPEDGSPMTRNVLAKAVSPGGGGAALQRVAASVSRLLRFKLISRAGTEFAVTEAGKSLL